MPKAFCPACDADIEIEQEDASLFNQVRCPECDALLKVIEESPLELEEVSEEGEEDKEGDKEEDE